MAPISRMQQPIAQRKEHCCYDNRSGGICGCRPHQMAEPRSNGLIECALIKGIHRPEWLPETFYTSRRERNTDNAVGQASLPQVARAVVDKTTINTVAIAATGKIN